MQHTPGLRPKESGHDPAAVRRVSVNCETPPSTQSHIITLVVSPLIIRAAPSNQKSPRPPGSFPPSLPGGMPVCLGGDYRRACPLSGTRASSQPLAKCSTTAAETGRRLTRKSEMQTEGGAIPLLCYLSRPEFPHGGQR